MFFAPNPGQAMFARTGFDSGMAGMEARGACTLRVLVGVAPRKGFQPLYNLLLIAPDGKRATAKWIRQ